MQDVRAGSRELFSEVKRASLSLDKLALLEEDEDEMLGSTEYDDVEWHKATSNQACASPVKHQFDEKAVEQTDSCSHTLEQCHSHKVLETPSGDRQQKNIPDSTISTVAILDEEFDEWKIARAKDGRSYFYNRRTRESRWLSPLHAVITGGTGRRRIFAPKTQSEKQASQENEAGVRLVPSRTPLATLAANTPHTTRSSPSKPTACTIASVTAATPAKTVESSKPALERDGRENEAQPYPQAVATPDPSHFKVHSSTEPTHSGERWMAAEVDDIGTENQLPATSKVVDKGSTPCRNLFADACNTTPASTHVYCPYCGDSLDPAALGRHITMCEKVGELKASGALVWVEAALHPHKADNIAVTPKIKCSPQTPSSHGKPYSKSTYSNTNSTYRGSGSTERCEDCGRTFTAGRMEAHSRVCQRIFVQKRPVFDGSQARLRGTLLEYYNADHSAAKSTETLASERAVVDAPVCEKPLKRSCAWCKADVPPDSISRHMLKCSALKEARARRLRGRSGVA